MRPKIFPVVVPFQQKVLAYLPLTPPLWYFHFFISLEHDTAHRPVSVRQLQRSLFVPLSQSPPFVLSFLIPWPVVPIQYERTPYINLFSGCCRLSFFPRPANLSQPRPFSHLTFNFPYSSSTPRLTTVSKHCDPACPVFTLISRPPNSLSKRDFACTCLR